MTGKKSEKQHQGGPRFRFFGIAAIFIAVICVLSVFYLGHLQIRSVLKREGDLIAMAWFENVRHSDTGLAGLLEGTSPALRGGLLDSFAIDTLALIHRDGSLETIRGAPDATETELKPALAASGLPRGDRRSTILVDHSSFLAPVMATWVVFPAMSDGRQLALRLDQRVEATNLSNTFKRELVYLSGIAVVTFFSFMAGFTYRTRQMQREKQDLVYLAMHDELTGLANRKHFEQRLAEALGEAERSEHKIGLLILDLDGFKAVNDTLGHPVGDNLLRATAERLKNSLREEDLLCRLAGDEFAVIVPLVQDVGALRALAERMLRLIEQPFRIDGQEIQIGCSIGMTIGPDNGDDVKTLIRNADFALYRAKGGGRRTWRFFDPKMAEDQRSRETLEDGLRYAIQNELFTILYQPQHDLLTGEVVCYEALLRWRLPSKNLVPTSMFLSVAEETGLIIPMGEWVVRQVARDLNVLPPESRIAINLSAAQLQRDGTDAYIAEALASADVAPARLEIEVNESILGRGEKAALNRLEGMREAGISIVLDNFGVGTSSLGLVSRYPFDKIKLDRTFLARIDDPDKARAVVGAICNLGASLGMVVVGEGVETAEHKDILASCGCNLGQGYYFGHPVTLEEVVGDIARITARKAQANLSAGRIAPVPAVQESGAASPAAEPGRLAAGA